MLTLHQKYEIEGVNFMVSNCENGLLCAELAEGWGAGAEAASSAATRNLGGGPMATRS